MLLILAVDGTLRGWKTFLEYLLLTDVGVLALRQLILVGDRIAGANLAAARWKPSDRDRRPEVDVVAFSNSSVRHRHIRRRSLVRGPLSGRQKLRPRSCL